METENSNFEQEVQQDKMPTFLKVLCILTFVGSGLSLLGSIASFTFLTPDVLFEAMAKNAARLKSTLPPYDEFVQWTTYSNIVGLLTGLLGLIGGILMWKRKKVGFFLYVTSWVGFIVMTIAASSHVSDSFSAKVMPVTIAVYVLLMLAFVIMYGVNLKHMNK